MANIPTPFGADLLNNPFLQWLFHINLIQYDPVLCPVDGIRAYIRQFQLDGSYLNQSKSVEEFYFLVVSQIPFMRFMESIHVPILTYGPCGCTNQDHTSQANPSPVPVINIPYGELQNTIKQTVEHHLGDRPIQNHCGICKRQRRASKRLLLQDFPIGICVQIARQEDINDDR